MTVHLRKSGGGGGSLHIMNCFFWESDRITLPDSAPTSIWVGNSDIPFVTHARNLRIPISSNKTMDKHVTNLCRSAYAEPRRISSIRHLLTVNTQCNQNSPLCLCSLKARPLQLPPLWHTSIHSGHASKSTTFCSKISHEIPQMWSCTASFAQPSLVTSPLKDKLQDFNPVLQHFHQFFSCLHCSASICLRPFQSPPFTLRHMHHLYSFCQN